jgi:hypothetical protein
MGSAVTSCRPASQARGWLRPASPELSLQGVLAGDQSRLAKYCELHLAASAASPTPRPVTPRAMNHDVEALTARLNQDVFRHLRRDG